MARDGINVYFGYSALPVVTEENTNLDGLESQIVRPDEDTEDIREYLAATTALAGEMDSDTAIYIFDETQYNEMVASTDYPIFCKFEREIPGAPYCGWLQTDGKGHRLRKGFFGSQR